MYLFELKIFENQHCQDRKSEEEAYAVCPMVSFPKPG